MIGKVLLVILGVFLLLGAFASPINTGIKGMRTEDTTENSVVTTGAAATTANVTLASDLFRDNVAEVITITSNRTGESPVATSYTAASNKLLVSALDAGQTRTLTINYYAETDNTAMRAIGPFLGILVFGACLYALAGNLFRKR